MASCLLLAGASAADVYVTGYLGDVINLHGYSYRGTQVYLFMTGPGLPADGVTLTDVTQRADQGQFTIVDLDSSQQWWFNWDTSRIWNEINPGTYTVYVSTEPVDYSHLGSSDTYKTLSVYLQDPGTRKGGSSTTSYALHLDDQGTPQTTVQSVEIPAPTLPVTPARQPTVPVPSVVVTTAAARSTPTQATLQPLTAIIAVLGCTGLLHRRLSRR
ncbi:hypothetical protein [Methanoregula sp.]|uniref:hypothetical protein n=1 Tax=Methanoregula sp. TaxID=2052170 RepID=UPI002CA38C21|nr:hypothetical protein [Methanoregula sp.]HVP95553.1 hypothetical protein [Methanoregula sp.]